MMVARWKKQVQRVAEEGRLVQLGMKRRNFCKDAEEQLCRSELHVTHVRIVDNQFIGSGLPFTTKRISHEDLGRNDRWRQNGAPSNMTSPNS